MNDLSNMGDRQISEAKIMVRSLNDHLMASESWQPAFPKHSALPTGLSAMHLGRHCRILVLYDPHFPVCRIVFLAISKCVPFVACLFLFARAEIARPWIVEVTILILEV